MAANQKSKHISDKKTLTIWPHVFSITKYKLPLTYSICLLFWIIRYVGCCVSIVPFGDKNITLLRSFFGFSLGGEGIWIMFEFWTESVFWVFPAFRMTPWDSMKPPGNVREPHSSSMEPHGSPMKLHGSSIEPYGSSTNPMVALW